MAFPVLEAPDKVAPKQKVSVIERVRTVIKTKLPPFTDTLVLLTIAFWYFFWTGFAIVLGREIPKEWLRIATHLSRGKIAKRVHEMKEAQDEPVKPSNGFRVVDLDTKRPVPLV